MTLDQLRGVEKLLAVAINAKLQAEKLAKGGKVAKKAAAPKLHLGDDRDVYDDEPDLMSGYAGGGGGGGGAPAAAAEAPEAPFKRNQFQAESDFM